MPKVFISLITFNDDNSTKECLDSLERLKKTDFDLSVVVIDNASSKEFKIAREYKNFDLKIIRSSKNLGFSGGQNLGIKYALENACDFILILNNDVVVDENLVIELLNALDDKRIGIVSPKIYFAKGFEYHKERYSENEKGKVFWYAGAEIDWGNVIGRHIGVDEVDKGQFDRSEETEVATGCCMLLKREVLEAAGIFDEKFFLYYEDADLSQRVKKKGFQIYYVPKAVLWHKNAAATGTGSPLQDYYITRNRLLFGFRYAALRVKLALIRESIRLLLLGRKWQRTGVKDFYLRRFGKGSFKTNE
ncbi:MAG: glycosyltransferase family 2 protein [Candidatus Levybacteria bacterium]|nr:glycosyltransferase family 2 protein [Candidatus Levybacteria bacterium]